MKVLLINGSPRKNGNTQSILNLYGEVLQKHLHFSTNEIVNISLSEKAIQLCRGCRTCMEHCENLCPCKDDVKSIEEQMNTVDIIIIGTPVYVEDISGLTKIWIDRMAFHCHRPFLNGKTVYIFTTSGAKASSHAIKTLKHAFLAWGARVIDEKNFSMGARMKNMYVKNNFEKIIDKQIDQLEKTRDIIPLFSLVSFQVQKNFWIRKGSETESYDYSYWKSKLWLEKSSIYYFPVKVNNTKKIIAKIVAMIVGKVLY